MTQQLHPSVRIQQKGVCVFIKRQASVFIAAPFIIARNYWEAVQTSINNRTAFSLILANPYDRILCSNDYMNYGYIHMNWANEAKNRRGNAV